MNNFDRAMNALDEKFGFLASTNQIVSSINEEEKVKNIYNIKCFIFSP
jgi:1,4-alpha-glucan branching enzyme